MSTQSQHKTLIDHLLTIPEAQVRIFDLEWQSIFYTVFHQTKISQMAHAICMAPIVFVLYALASYIPLGEAAVIPSLSGLTAINGAFVVMLVLTVWYLAMDITVGLISLPFVVAFWVLANAFNLYFELTGITIAIITLFAASFIQTVSHQPEAVPPPHSGTDGFVAYKDWMKNTTLRHKMRVFLMFPIFTLTELISSPRLFPVQLLRLMHKFGYRKAMYERTERKARYVLETGDYKAY